jgi:hypothetical protein
LDVQDTAGKIQFGGLRRVREACVDGNPSVVGFVGQAERCEVDVEPDVGWRENNGFGGGRPWQDRDGFCGPLQAGEAHHIVLERRALIGDGLARQREMVGGRFPISLFRGPAAAWRGRRQPRIRAARHLRARPDNPAPGQRNRFRGEDPDAVRRGR